MDSDRIIIGGSDMHFLNLLSEKIKSAFPGKQVYTTDEAFDAWYYIHGQKPGTAVLEMIFPQWDWNGFLLFKFLKKDARFKGMKSVLITDTLNENAQKMAEDEDIDKVLYKVYNIDFIFEEIRKMI